MLAVLVQVRSTQHVSTLDAKPLLLFALNLFNLQDIMLTDDGGRARPACSSEVGGGGIRLSRGLVCILDKVDGAHRSQASAVIVLVLVSGMPLRHSHFKT